MIGYLKSKEDLKKSINYIPNSYMKKIEKIVKYDGMIGIYGAGVMGRKLGEILLHYGIVPDYYIVDEEYYNDSIICIGDKDVSQVMVSQFLKYDGSKMVLNAIELHNQDYREAFAMVEDKFMGCKVIDFEHINLFICQPITYDFVLENIDAFWDTYQMLEDELSRKIFVEFINANIADDSSRLDCLCEPPYYKDDYDYSMLLNRSNGDIIECGAYNGETVLQINEKLDGKSNVYALEPGDMNYNILQKRIKSYNNIIAYKYGALDFDGRVSLVGDAQNGCSTVSSVEDDSGEIIEVRKLDTLFKDHEIASIMMDIEGSELAALKGSHDIIAKYHPTLGIRIYHKKNDLITIPQYIRNNFSDKKYKFYLRKNTLNRGYMDTTFYAI